MPFFVGPPPGRHPANRSAHPPTGPQEPCGRSEPRTKSPVAAAAGRKPGASRAVRGRPVAGGGGVRPALGWNLQKWRRRRREFAVFRTRIGVKKSCTPESRLHFKACSARGSKWNVPVYNLCHRRAGRWITRADQGNPGTPTGCRVDQLRLPTVSRYERSKRTTTAYPGFGSVAGPGRDRDQPTAESYYGSCASLCKRFAQNAGPRCRRSGGDGLADARPEQRKARTNSRVATLAEPDSRQPYSLRRFAPLTAANEGYRLKQIRGARIGRSPAARRVHHEGAGTAVPPLFTGFRCPAAGSRSDPSCMDRRMARSRNATSSESESRR